MKKTIKLLGIITFVAVIGFSIAACGGGEKNITSADALKAYLDSQPANSPDKPIKVAMKINENMVENIKEAINSAGKYVSLNLTGSPLTTIPSGAFRNCKSLTSITIPIGVTEIGARAFASTGITSITIPNSVTSIGSLAFFECEDLTSITFGSGVTTIGEQAFNGCYRLTSITIPASVTSIEYGAFVYCDGLTSVTFEGNGITIGNRAFNTFEDGLRSEYRTNGTGTYTKRVVDNVDNWSKQ